MSAKPSAAKFRMRNLNSGMGAPNLAPGKGNQVQQHLYAFLSPQNCSACP